MPPIIEDKAPNSLEQVRFEAYGKATPSPVDWRDQVFYFLLPDRFSHGQESADNLFDLKNPGKFKTVDKKKWMEGGKKFQGGTLKGIKSKLTYLRDLGITALWLGPIWKQRKDLEPTRIWNPEFPEVDPAFKGAWNLINEAHAQGTYVILDIIYNHSGNNWYYDIDGNPGEMTDYRYQPPYDFYGWRSASGVPTPSILGAEDGVWPQEFQDVDWYTRAGKIGKWDPEPWEDPMHPDNEFRRGDFYDLKDFDLDHRSGALSAIIDVYKYWIGLSDADGFRIDTVKHASFEVCKNFCGAIHEYAESIGKENFFLVGEVTGGSQMARNYLDIFGRNVDAVLDIGRRKNLSAWSRVRLLCPRSWDTTSGYRRRAGIISPSDDQPQAEKSAHGGSSMTDTPRPPCRPHNAHHAKSCLYYGTEQVFDGSTAYRQKHRQRDQ
jgi:glycosidase